MISVFNNLFIYFKRFWYECARTNEYLMAEHVLDSTNNHDGNKLS